MRAGREVVVFGKQPAQDGPESERAEHPPGNILPLGFLHFQVRPVGQIDPVGIRHREQLGLPVHGSTHLAEQRILEAGFAGNYVS